MYIFSPFVTWFVHNQADLLQVFSTFYCKHYKIMWRSSIFQFVWPLTCSHLHQPSWKWLLQQTATGHCQGDNNTGQVVRQHLTPPCGCKWYYTEWQGPFLGKGAVPIVTQYLVFINFVNSELMCKIMTLVGWSLQSFQTKAFRLTQGMDTGTVNLQLSSKKHEGCRLPGKSLNQHSTRLQVQTLTYELNIVFRF